MTKYIVLFLGTLLFISCGGPQRVRKADRLYNDISNNIRFSDYTIVLKTKDSTLYLKNAVVTDSGMLRAERIAGPVKGRRIVIHSTARIAEMLDSNGSLNSDSLHQVQFSKNGVNKVIIYDRFNGSNRRMLYDKNYDNKKVLRTVLFIVIGAMLVVILVIAIIYFIIASIINACYIATMVYGSYDSPEVLVLRKFRDEKLATNRAGRLFIHIYYKLSPGFVYVFKNSKTVNKAVRFVLDILVRRLIAKEEEKMMNVK